MKANRTANWEAEREVIGGCMMDPTLIGEVIEVLDFGDFARPDHRRLFEIMASMDARSDPINSILVLEECERLGEIDTCGGAMNILGHPQMCVSVEIVVSRARRVADCAKLQRLRLVAASILEDVTEGADDATTTMDRAESAMLALSHARIGGSIESVADVLDAEIRAIQERAEHPDTFDGTPTGFADLDAMLGGGFRDDNLVLLAARPALGKSAMAMNVAMHAARRDRGVLVFTMEMANREIGGRMLAADGRVNLDAIRTGKVDPRDGWRQLCESHERLRGLPIWLDETPAQSVSAMRSKARRIKALHPNLGLVVIDYLQLATMADSPRGASRENVVASISRGLKVLAKEIHVPVLAVAQLNRGPEQRSEKRPGPADLRESGSLEQDADAILFLYRDEVYNEDTPDKGIAEVIVAKQRGGRTGTVKLAWSGQHQRFDSLAFAPEPGHEQGGYV